MGLLSGLPAEKVVRTSLDQLCCVHMYTTDSVLLVLFYLFFNSRIQGTLELSSALNQHVCHVENTVERGKEEREELYLLHREQDLKYKV